jgi:hypothetical protein
MDGWIAAKPLPNRENRSGKPVKPTGKPVKPTGKPKRAVCYDLLGSVRER